MLDSPRTKAGHTPSCAIQPSEHTVFVARGMRRNLLPDLSLPLCARDFPAGVLMFEKFRLKPSGPHLRGSSATTSDLGFEEKSG